MLQPRHMSREELIQTAIDQATDNPLAYHLALMLEASASPEEREALENEAEYRAGCIDALEEEIRSLETNNLRIEQEAESLSNELEDARAEIRHLERQCADLERENEILRTYE